MHVRVNCYWFVRHINSLLIIPNFRKEYRSMTKDIDQKDLLIAVLREALGLLLEAAGTEKKKGIEDRNNRVLKCSEQIEKLLSILS